MQTEPHRFSFRGTRTDINSPNTVISPRVFPLLFHWLVQTVKVSIQVIGRRQADRGRDEGCQLVVIKFKRDVFSLRGSEGHEADGRALFPSNISTDGDTDCVCKWPVSHLKTVPAPLAALTPSSSSPR